MSSAASSDLGSTRASTAVVLLFAFNGLVIGAYAAAIPTLQLRHSLNSQLLSLLFVCVGLAAVLAMQLAGRLSDRIGARRVSLAGFPLAIVGILGVGQAPTFGWLIFFGVLLGASNGILDVTMNAIGVQVEQHRQRPIMSFFHGMWSVGNLIGAALLVATAAAFQLYGPSAITVSTGTAAAIGTAAWIIAFRITPETEPVIHTTTQGRPARLPASVYLLGLMAVAFGLGEGVATDWSSLHVTTVTGVPPEVAALGVTMMAAGMVIIRLLGDQLVSRFGRRWVTRGGGVGAAAGYLMVATLADLPLVLAGWTLVGLGIGMIAPQVYAVAGHSAGGRGLAVVVSFGYATFLIAPAIVGWLIGHLGIQATMFVPAVLLTGLVFIARVLPGRETEPGSAQ